MTTHVTPAEIDIVTVEIIQSGLVAICKDMGEAMIRTAYSPIFSEGRDFSTAVFDASCEMIGQGVGCPAQLGALPFLVDWCIRDIGLESLEPGDVVLHNDVYRGGTHLPEFTMIRPVFDDGRVIAFVANIAHHVDVGGKSPGGFPGDATDVFMEGFRLPPVKLYAAGEPDLNIWRIYLSNVRTPHNSYGDLHAMHSSILIGEARLQELRERYGRDTMLATFEHIKDSSEQRMRREIAKIPDGVYRAADWMEDDGVTDRGPFEIRVTVMVDGEQVVIDFTGSSPQAVGPINCPYGVTASGVYNAILQLADPDIPTNSGSFRPIRLVVPGGTVVNVDYPGAEFGGNTETHNRIVDVIHTALADAIPRRITGAEGGTCMNLTYGGEDPATGEQFANYQWEGIGWGARHDKDGNSVVVPPVGNSRIQSVEVLETRFPWLHECYRLRTDSGGAGRFRGGLGTERIMVAQSDMVINGLADRHEIAPPGRFGADGGGASGYWIRRNGQREWHSVTAEGAKSPTKFANIALLAGDAVCVHSPGGGGYGDPADRGRDLIERDLREGYIGEERARVRYGWQG